MKAKTKNLSTILSAALLLALVGCGSDPVTECISSDQALNALRQQYAGINPCDTDANGQDMIPGCPPGGVLVQDPYTAEACAYKGPVDSCGQPPNGDTTCNVKGRFTVQIFHKEDGSCTTQCFTPGQIRADNLHIGCHSPNGTSPCDGTVEEPDPSPDDHG